MFNPATTNLQSLLEYLFQEAGVEEAAVSVNQARSEKLALMINKSSGRETSLTLYRPDLILSKVPSMTDNIGAYSGTARDKIFDSAEYIVGYVSFVTYAKGASKIMLSGADRGYGPMLYDIALSVVFPGSLMSDRVSVSKSAQKVWKYYFENRPDVIKRPVPIRKTSNPLVSMPNLSKSAWSLGVTIRDLKNEINEFDIKDPQAEYTNNKKYRGLSMRAIKNSLKQELNTLIQKYNEMSGAANANNPLAFAYQIKKPRSFSSLIKNHNDFLLNMEKAGSFSKDQIQDALLYYGERSAQGKIRG